MAKLECVIFDWAGTTVDFGSLSPVSAFREAFRSYGVEVTEEETRAPMGMLKIDHIRTMLAMPEVEARFVAAKGVKPTDVDALAIYESFEPALMKVLAQHCDIKCGVRECVKALEAQGIRIGSTTGFTQEMMNVVTVEAAKNGYAPETYVTAEVVGGLGRPWPYMIFENMKRLGITRTSRVMKVGDTVSDIAEAKAAGVIAVGVLVGSSVMGLSRSQWDALNEVERMEHCNKAREVFRKAGADFVIDDLTQLPALVKTIEVA